MDDDDQIELLTLEELMTASRYSILIRWSEEDRVYIADVPELRGARTHGSTVAEAAEMAHEVAAMLISTARARGEHIPNPRSVIRKTDQRRVTDRSSRS